MENAVDALKIAFSALMFVVALSLGISSFSSANEAVKVTMKQQDREIEIEYDHIEPSENLTRIVGIETVIPTMYQAYRENFVIYFFYKDGQPLPLYYKTDANSGKLEKDEKNSSIEINYIDLSRETYGIVGNKTSATEIAIEHLDILLAGKKSIQNYTEPYKSTYKKLYTNQFKYTEGLYNFFKDKKFEESLGEYTQSSGASSITKRVITYKLQN